MKKALSAVLAVVLVLGVCFSVPMIVSGADANDLTFELNDAGTGYIVTGCKTDANGELVIPDTYNPTESKEENVVNPVNADEGEEITEPAGDDVVEESSSEDSEEPSSEDSEEPSSEDSEEPSSEDSEEPSSEDSEEPSSEDSEEPSSENSEEPSTEETTESESTTEAVVVTKYNVAIDDKIQSGSVASDVFEAAEGDTVTLLVIPAEDYILRELTIKDASDAEVIPAKDAEDEAKYTFTMPDCAVSITAEFVPAELPVVAIADEAFKDCGELTKVTIGKNIATIGKNAFAGCAKIAEFAVATENTTFTVEAGVLFNADKTTLVVFPAASGEKYVMPETVINVAEGAFSGSALKSVKYVFTTQAKLTIAENNEVLNAKGVLHLGMKDHTMDEGTTSPSNCTQNGQIVYKCTVCELEMNQELLPVDTKNHIVGDWEVKEEATCVKEGTEVKKCTLCEAEVETRAIEATGHTVEEWETTVEPTCVAEGSKKGTCTVCEEEVTEKIAMLVHDIVLIGAKEATCTQEGYTGNRYCNECNDIVERGEAIPVIAHTVETWEEVTAATCTTVGFQKGTCTVCENEVTEEIPAINHKNASIVGAIAATCEGVGYTGDKVCPDCEETLETGSEIDELGHDVKEWDLETNPPTCTEAGTKTGVCERCEETITEDVSALNHPGTILKNESEADCENAGYTGDTHCALCDELLREGEEISALGHTVEEWETTLEPTCTEKGSKKGVCTVCENEVTEEIPATNHPDASRVNAKEATCTQEGHTGYLYCPDCKTVVDRGETIPMVAHTVEEWDVTTPATCTEEGVKTGTCSVCGKDDVTATIDKIAHTEADGEVITEATCTEAGERKVVCGVCGEELGTKEIPATNHANYELIGAVAATCTEAGYTGDKVCNDCFNVVVGEVIPATGHDESVWVTVSEATCTTAGSRYTECTICEDKIKEEVIPALGHNFSDNECTRDNCETKEFEYKFVEDVLIITGYNGMADILTIPAEFEDTKVTSIGKDAFNGNVFSTVFVPDTVTVIGEKAFANCENLEIVNIPATVTTIGLNAFGYTVVVNPGAEGEDATETTTKLEGFKVYGVAGSAAETYATENGFTFINIADVYTVNTEVAAKKEDCLFVDSTIENDGADLLSLGSDYTAEVTASYTYEDIKLYGTGSVVNVYDNENNLIDQIKVAVQGDINGDGICDVIDCMLINLAENSHIDLENEYLVAGDYDGNSQISIEDFQQIVDQAVSYEEVEDEEESTEPSDSTESTDETSSEPTSETTSETESEEESTNVASSETTTEAPAETTTEVTEETTTEATEETTTEDSGEEA